MKPAPSVRRQAKARLWPWLTLSTLIHLLALFGLPGQRPAPAPSRPPVLEARLQPALPPSPPADLHLVTPEKAEKPPTMAKPARPAPKTPQRTVPAKVPHTAPTARLSVPGGRLPDAAAREANRQLARLAAQPDFHFYPLEAIAKGWQGEVEVEIFLDARGHVIAARLARSSGYPLLDEAALRAARSLRSLPADGLEQAILPVRFRLE
jgi:protein TonB